LVLDSTGRYLYYCPGAHGTACNDGTPFFQFDIKTGKVTTVLRYDLWQKLHVVNK